LLEDDPSLTLGTKDQARQALSLTLGTKDQARQALSLAQGLAQDHLQEALRQEEEETNTHP
ncbi:MAG: hypothetical protein P8P48_10760, partial [Saprospiraceae bacterium]|nr:hypothetical protein [Saprospiraceae bacterium]